MTVAKKKKVRQAECVGGGGIHTTTEMLKFVAGGDGRIYLDVAQKLTTSSVYINPTPAAVRAALETNALTDALGVSPLENKKIFQAEMQAVLEKSCLARMGVARKAGHLVLGTRKAQQAAGEGTAQAVFMPTDAGKDTRNTLEMMAQQNNLPIFYVGVKHQWAQVFHKENITVAAITAPQSLPPLRFLGQAVHAFGGGMSSPEVDVAS